MKMYPKTRKALRSYSLTLIPSSARAQCINIEQYSLEDGESISERIIRDHMSPSDAMRSMGLLVQSGCAKEIGAKNGLYGKFIFEDGSEYN